MILPYNHISELPKLRFPKDIVIRKIWTNNVRRKNFIPTDESCLCSKHFLEDDFERKFPTNVLKKTAVPTVFDFQSKFSKRKQKKELNKEPL